MPCYRYDGSTVWMKRLPAAVRDVVRQYPQGLLYRVKTTGQVGYIVEYGEQESGPVTLRMDLWRPSMGPTGAGAFFRRQVSGIRPEDIEEHKP